MILVYFDIERAVNKDLLTIDLCCEEEQILLVSSPLVLPLSSHNNEDTRFPKNVVYCKDKTELAKNIHQFLVKVEREHAKEWTLVTFNREPDLQKINQFLVDASFPDMYHFRDGSFHGPCEIIVSAHDLHCSKLRAYSIW